MNRAFLAFVLLAAACGFPAASGAAAAKSIAAFCRANPGLDFPGGVFHGRGREAGVPAEVAAVQATNWRCMDGKVYVCAGGASGSACERMNPSRRPSPAIRETCRDNPGQAFVAIAAIGNSSSTWRCRGRTATIIQTYPLDTHGFLLGTWAPLFDARGRINRNVELGADPR